MILQFLFKMFACSAMLFGYYYFFLRNKRFHHYNRFYLLSIVLLSLIIPWIRIPVFLETNNPTAEIVSRSIGLISVSDWEEEGLVDTSVAGAASWLTWQTVSFAVYLLVIVILIYWLVKSLMYIRRLTRKYVCQPMESFNFYNTTELGTPFSFFKSIFWNSGVDVDSNDGQKMFNHELFHVKQKHSIDVLLMEIVCVFFWINPMFHLIKREIRAIHEFLADQQAIQIENRHDYAELLILHSLRSKKSIVPNYFFQNHIKRRIAMITQLKTKNYGYSSRLLALPLGIMIFCSIALYAQRGVSGANIEQPATFEVERATESITVVVDAGHGGTDDGATNDAGIREKDLALAIAKEIQEQAVVHNINVVMTREGDVSLGLKQRSELAHAAKANLFVSIHVNNAPKDSPENGFDIFITNRNQQTLSESRRLGEHIARNLNHFYRVAPIKQRKEQGIWVLDKVSCPAVLIECGYITNTKDLAFVMDPSNQQKIAKNILKGIVDYYAKAGAITSMDTIPGSIVLNDTTRLTEAQKQRQLAQSKEIKARLGDLNGKQKALAERNRELKINQQAFHGNAGVDYQLQQKQLTEKHRQLEVAQKKMAEARLMEMKFRKQEIALNRKEIELAQEKIARAGLTDTHRKELLQKKQELSRLHEAVSEDDLSALQLQKKLLANRQQELDLLRKQTTETRLAQIKLEKQIRLQKMQEQEIRQNEEKTILEKKLKSKREEPDN